MWHLLKKFNRIVARKVTDEQANRLILGCGGQLDPNHIPPDPNLVGYVINDKPIYAYGQIVIEADGHFVACVTRKDDAFRIMQALKRDYKEIYVKLKNDL